MHYFLHFYTSFQLVHRDLATRNVLVGHDYVIKVADFGFTRSGGKNDYYKMKTDGLMPVKWMAPESLFDSICTSRSDV